MCRVLTLCLQVNCDVFIRSLDCFFSVLSAFCFLFYIFYIFVLYILTPILLWILYNWTLCINICLSFLTIAFYHLFVILFSHLVGANYLNYLNFLLACFLLATTSIQLSSFLSSRQTLMSWSILHLFIYDYFSFFSPVNLCISIFNF